MEAKLRANDHKRHWRFLDMRTLSRLLTHEIEELRLAVERCDPEEVLREAADVANFCMMTADMVKRNPKKANEQDARTMSEECDASWPKNAPHRAVLLGDVAAERERCAMICDKAAEMAWSRWEIMADQFDQGAAAEAEKLANSIREGQELEQRRESPAR